MAKFTAGVPLNLRLSGGFEVSGAVGATHRLPDELVEEFTRDQVPQIAGGVTWITQDETTSKYDKTGGTITGDAQVTGRFGVVDTPSNRIPINIAADVSAAVAGSAGSSNVIGVEFSPRITGDFTTVAGVDQGYVWGVNDFTVIGQSGSTVPQKINQGTAFLAELAVIGSAVTATTLRALHADISYFGTSAGGAVTTMESLRVTPPRRKEGATGGSIVNAYGLFIEAPTATYASSGNFALFTEGGPSRFNGRLEVETVTGHLGAVELFANYTRAAGASIRLEQNSAGGHAIFYIANSTGYIGVSDGTTLKQKLMRNGIVTTGGTAFPAGPSTDDLFYRTDYDCWFFWNGTYWLSSHQHTVILPPWNALPGYAASTIPILGVVPWGGTGDLYVDNIVFAKQIASGANSAGNTWSHQFTVDELGDLGSPATSLGDLNNARSQVVSVGALIGASASRGRWYVTSTKSGSAGNLTTISAAVNYRIRAT